MPETVEKIARLLLDRGLTLATAESCTGGAVAARITTRAGASDYFLGGVVSYANSAKTALLGVRPYTLAQHGAVSRETAIEMALGALERFGASCAVATTGIAGPGGAVPGKPVGTVWIAVATATPAGVEARLLQLPEDNSRSENIGATVDAALGMVYEIALQGFSF